MELQSFTRKQLYDLVWKEPIQALAPKFGLSDRGLAKLCERHAVPTPPRGYWAKKEAGHKVTKVPLIELDGGRVKDTHAIARFAPPPRPAGPQAEEAPDPLLQFWQEQRSEIGIIKVAKTLTNPHPVIRAWLEEDERQRQAQARWGGPSLGHFRTTPLDRRRLRLLSALYTALEARGVTIHCPRNTRFAELRHAHETVSFDLKEYVRQLRRPLNEKEIADGWGAHNKYRVEQTPTGFFRGKVDAWLPRGVTAVWTETEEAPFETLLGEVAATILTAFAQKTVQREEREAAEHRRWEEREAARLREEAEKAERARKQALRSRAKAWRQAQTLREYVNAVSAAREAGRLACEAPAFLEWRDWALAHALQLDPIEAGDALDTSER